MTLFCSDRTVHFTSRTLCHARGTPEPTVHHTPCTVRLKHGQPGAFPAASRAARRREVGQCARVDSAYVTRGQRLRYPARRRYRTRRLCPRALCVPSTIDKKLTRRGPSSAARASVPVRHPDGSDSFVGEGRQREGERE